MWIAIGFAAACAAGVWLLPVHFIIPSIFVLLVLAVLGWKFRLKRPAVMVLGSILGLAWFLGFHHLYLIPAHAMDGTTIETSVTAVDYSYKTDYGVAVDGEFTLDGRTYKIRLYVNDSGELLPGDTITGTFNLRYTAPGGMRDSTYHAGDGILFLGYERGSAAIRRAAEAEAKYFSVRLRRTICEFLDSVFPADVAPFARALLLGDDTDLDYETDTALKISGVRHIIAVSGLHVAILFALLRTVTFNRHFLTALLGIPVLALFCAAAGFTPSVTRACIMVGLMMLSQVLNKEYDPFTALAFAALVMLLYNPLVITSVSFQMSVACVAGILLFQESIIEWLYGKFGVPKGKSLGARLKRAVFSSVGVSLSATLLTMPMAAWYFGTVSLVGILANLLTLWAVSLAFYGIVAVCIVSIVWLKGTALLAWITAWGMRYVVWMAKLLSAFPFAAVYTKSIYIVFWLILVYILLAVFLMSKSKRPLVLSCCAVLGLCLSLLASWTEHTLSDTHFTCLDVGQGQSLILHHEGKTLLMDCGASNDEIAANTAAETLLSRGISHLDGIILTHCDRDHSGGVPYLLTRIDADFLMLPATIAPEDTANITGNWSGNVIPVDDDLLLSIGEGKITVFGPTFGTESNENSLCILFESEKCAILITGDRDQTGERILLHEAALPDVDLLIAGHHGSKNSTSPDLLNTVRPETVIISVGENNAYGHPAQALLDRLTDFGCEIWRTDLHGTIIFRR
jgi:competence protein ComEC